MKTKIALAVAVAALFVAVPGATPKKLPAGVTLTVGCSENLDPVTGADTGTDSCIVSATGLPKGTYWVKVTDSCGLDHESGASANFSMQFPASDCGTGLTIQLFGVGRGGTLTPMTVTITDNTGGVV